MIKYTKINIKLFYIPRLYFFLTYHTIFQLNNNIFEAYLKAKFTSLIELIYKL